MNDQTRKEIDKRVLRVLKDAGIKKPPVHIEDILECLKIHRNFYDLDDPSLLRRCFHKIKVGGVRLKQLKEKINLSAIWMPDEELILVDKSLPVPKRDWASFHDTTHTILNWHIAFFLGDTAQTLDPDYQEILENEANYGASALMFAGKIFTQDALDTHPEWSSIDLLQKRYKKSLVTTLRRYVEFTHDIPMLMMVSTPRWLDIPSDRSSACRHLVYSPSYLLKFSEIDPESLVTMVNSNISKRRGGLVGSFEYGFNDLNDNLREFRAECFFNTHDVLTMAVQNGR